MQDNLVMTRHLDAADGTDTASVLATLSRHSRLIVTLHVLPEVSFTTSRISSPTSGAVDLGCHCWYHELQNSRVHKGGDGYLQIFSFLGVFALDTFFGSNKQAATAIPSAKPYKKCISASS
jgi:hypothetical protein